MFPSSSLDADASKSTSSGAVPDAGVAVNDAVGARLSGSTAVTVRVACAVAPSSSVTTSVTM